MEIIERNQVKELSPISAEQPARQAGPTFMSSESKLARMPRRYDTKKETFCNGFTPLFVIKEGKK